MDRRTVLVASRHLVPEGTADPAAPPRRRASSAPAEVIDLAILRQGGAHKRVHHAERALPDADIE